MKRFLSFFIIFAMFVSLSAFSASAVDTTVDDDTTGTGTSQNGSFWQMIVQNHIAGHETVLDSIIQYIAGKACGQICSVSSDGLHHCNGFDIVTKDQDGNKCYRAICTECGEYFYCYDGDFEDAYDESLTFYDDSISSSIYLVLDSVSCGKYIYSVCGIDTSTLYGYESDFVFDSAIDSASSFLFSNPDNGYFSLYLCFINNQTTYTYSYRKLNAVIGDTLSFSVPLSGSWSLFCEPGSCSGQYDFDDYSIYYYYPITGEYYISPITGEYSTSLTASVQECSIGSLYTTDVNSFSPYVFLNVNSSQSVGYISASYYLKAVCTTSDSVSAPSNPGGLSFDIQVTNEDNSVTVQNIQFVDETNNQFYDTTTNTWVTYESYDYNFDERAYTFYLDTGDTVNLTYGDEYITYVTGGNTYNYYYYTTIINDDGGGDGTGEDDSGDDSEDDNSGILEWLEKIYKAIKNIDSGNDFDLTINNYTEGEQDSESFFDEFKLKLKWIRDVYEIAQMLLGGAAAQADAAYAYAAAVSEAESGEGSSDSVSNLATGAPSIYLNLGNANSHYGYDYGGSCVAIDFSWFAAYKPTVDSITGGFLWLLYLWGLVKNVPSIINGMGMTENRMSGMVAKFLDDDRK